MCDLPYKVTWGVGTVEKPRYHCPKCNIGTGAYVTLENGWVEERVDNYHMKRTMKDCGHVYIFHVE